MPIEGLYTDILQEFMPLGCWRQSCGALPVALRQCGAHGWHANVQPITAWCLSSSGSRSAHSGAPHATRSPPRVSYGGCKGRWERFAAHVSAWLRPCCPPPPACVPPSSVACPWVSAHAGGKYRSTATPLSLSSLWCSKHMYPMEYVPIKGTKCGASKELAHSLICCSTGGSWIDMAKSHNECVQYRCVGGRGLW
jgi:hypothetical protein